MKPHMTKIFDQIDAYRRFCVDNGYPFNEADIGKHNTPWGHMQKSIANRRKPFNQWIYDGNALKRQRSFREKNNK